MTGEPINPEHDDYRQALEVIAEASEAAVKGMAGEVIRKAQLITAEEAMQDRIKELPKTDSTHPLYGMRYLCLITLIEAVQEDIKQSSDPYSHSTSPIFSATAQPDGSFKIYHDVFTRTEVEQLTREVCFVAGAEFDGFGSALQQIEAGSQQPGTTLDGYYRRLFNTAVGEDFQLEQSFITNERGEITHITLETRQGPPEETPMPSISAFDAG